MMRRCSLALVVLTLAGMAAGRAEAGLAVQFTSAAAAQNSGVDISIGFSFTTNSAVSVIALDYILPGRSGGDVRLYDATGTTLASATVLATDPTESTGGFTYNVHAIAPFNLAANTTYFVAGGFPPRHHNHPGRAPGPPTDPAPPPRFCAFPPRTHPQPPTAPAGGGLTPAYFSVNLALAPTAAPEPSTLAGGALAALGLIGYRLRRRQRTV